MATDRNTVWGIDLGTTYSCISRVDEYNHAVVENNRDGDPTTPSVVMFLSADQAEVGKAAKAQMQLEPDLVCELVKRRMGDADWRFEAHGHAWSAPEVSAQILRALATDAEGQTGEKVEKVVITVPAYFGIAERMATMAAGKMAGLEVADVLNEPTAAALSYGFGKGMDSEETVLVYDLGGGTFDVTVIRLGPDESGKNHIEVVATGGDARLGGANWDKELVGLISRKFMEENPDADDPLDDSASEGELKLKAEDVKRALTMRESVNQLVVSGAHKANVTITRQEFEEATSDLLARTIDFTRDTVAIAAEKGHREIDRVLLVGGSSFMPAVKERLSEAFGWTPELEDPNQAVAKGAALYGFQVELRDRIKQWTDAKDEGSTNGQPADVEEATRKVAEEAGVPVGMLQRLAETTITNVCSRGFGVRVLRDGRDGNGGDDDFFVDHLIKPNDKLPVDPPKEETYGTAQDNQRGVEIVLLEQSGSVASEEMAHNKVLEKGSFQLSGTDPRGAPVFVALGMANNGVLTLTARDQAGHELSFSAAAESAVMSEEQIEESTARVQAIQRA